MENLMFLFAGLKTRIDMLFTDPSLFVVSLLFDLNNILNFMIQEWKVFLPVLVLVRIYYVLERIASRFRFLEGLYVAVNGENAKTLVELARDVRDMKEKFIKRGKAEIILP